VAKVKLLLQCLILIGLMFGSNVILLSAKEQTAESVSNQYTQVDTVNTDWQSDQTIPDTYEQVAENTLFKLYTDKTTLSFIVVDQRSGYVWHSGLDQIAEGDRLNKSWKAFAGSAISIDYLDQKAVSKRTSITNSTTTIDVKPIDQGVESTVTFVDFGITIGVSIRLEPNGVRVDIPIASIKQESPDYKLGNLYVYPFFGATRADSVPGYMFIPDGSGALIRFSAETKATNMFYGKYYGTDLGMITSLPYDPTIRRPYRISIPVFGMVHGYKQNAFVCIVENGASYGELQAHPSGVTTNFNFLYSAFTYNQSYFQATSRSGDGVTILQHDTNSYNITLQYRFLTGGDSDYVGMAKSYQQYLIDQGELKKNTVSNPDIGIRLEFLGGEKEKVLFWNRIIAMTTVVQMTDILNDLNIKNPDVIYFGWQPLGAASSFPKTLKLDGGLGSDKELRALAEQIAAGGGNLYLYLDPQAALADGGGYSSRNDLAMSITNSNLEGWNRGGRNYFLNLNALTKHYSSLSKDVFSKLNAGLALEGIGEILYSDFKSKNFLNREDAIMMYQKLMAENQVPTSFYVPNAYMYGYMNAYYDMPLSNSGYIYMTDTVPFIQIVLAGYVPYYGSALNFSSNLQEDLLKHADFGIYPSYFVTHDVTAKILNTKSNWIYTSSYSQWSQTIKQTYQWLDDLLAPVYGQEIVARDVLEAGVVATTYANGKQIIVNYNSQPITTGGIAVQGKGAVLTEVLP
jgi:hypothetical protein